MTAAALVIPALVLLLLVAAAFEKLVVKRLGWLPWRKRRDPEMFGAMSITGAGLDEFELAFRGTKPYRRDFKAVVADAARGRKSDGAPPRTRIDLDNNVANLVLRPDKNLPSAD
ncbi:hypothetical protein [Fodinicola feengrottensis]|uniref:hypothetical protein n=1 Tax=Fodinicola feengrottensis TaxID=435914 RepID=UPI0013CF6077|nr:hypothetical protein [Fodinicola feengrottensis]